jgi:hypothetical protein
VSELDAFDACEHVDAPRRHSDLIDDARARKVSGSYASQRGAEARQCLPDPLAVLRVGIDPDIEVLGVARLDVCRERDTTDD